MRRILRAGSRAVVPLAAAVFLFLNASVQQLSAQSGIAAAPSPESSASSAPSVAELIVLDLLNRERTGQGLQALHWDPALTAAAGAHAAAMAQAGTLTHQLPGEPPLLDRAAQQGAHFQAIAENVAYGPSPEAIERQWMQSAPHRANILDPRMDAIGIRLLPAAGTLWAVEDFAATVSSLSPQAVERQVEQSVQAHGLQIAAAESAEKQAARAACPQFEGGAGAGARFVVRWESSDLRTLPQPLMDAIGSNQYTRVAIGACAASNPRNRNFVAYRVAVLLF